MLRIDSGSAASTKLVRPRSLRTKTIMKAAVAESSAALAYSPTRKSRRDESVKSHHDQPRNKRSVLVMLRPQPPQTHRLVPRHYGNEC